MNENLYASPEPVEETLPVDKRWREHSQPLHITAWGLLLAGVGFLFLMLGFLLKQADMHIIQISEVWGIIAAITALGGLLLMFVGAVMCLACNGKVVRFGRLAVLGFLLCFFVMLIPWLAQWIISTTWAIAVATTFYAGLLSWCVFLWLLARTFELRHCMGWIGITITFWTVTLVLLIIQELFPWRYRFFDTDFWSLVAFLAGCAMCGLTCLLLRGRLLRAMLAVWDMEETP